MPYIYTNRSTGQEVRSTARRPDLAGWARWAETEVAELPTVEPVADDDATGSHVVGDVDFGSLSIEDMTVAQLDEVAASAGIDFPAGTVKAEKVALLAAAIPDNSTTE